MKDLREFEWGRLHQKMLETAPTLSSIFFSACRKERSNRIGVIILSVHGHHPQISIQKNEFRSKDTKFGTLC